MHVDGHILSRIKMNVANDRHRLLGGDLSHGLKVVGCRVMLSNCSTGILLCRRSTQPKGTVNDECVTVKVKRVG